jgi:hypothetical protein
MLVRLGDAGGGEDPGGDVVGPKFGRAEVAERDGGRFVPCLTHQLGQPGAGVAGGGGQTGAQRMPAKPCRIQSGIQGRLFDQPQYSLVRPVCPGDGAALADRAEQRPLGIGSAAAAIGGAAAVGQPGRQGRGWAEARVQRIGGDRDAIPPALLVGLRAANGQLHPAPGHGEKIAERERDEFGAPPRGGEAEQQHRPVARAKRHVHGRPGGEQAAQQIGHCRGRLAAWPDSGTAGDALQHHGKRGVAQIERHTGEQVRGADGGEADAQGADGAAVIGAADQVHGDGVGIAGVGLLQLGSSSISVQACAPFVGQDAELARLSGLQA